MPESGDRVIVNRTGLAGDYAKAVNALKNCARGAPGTYMVYLGNSSRDLTQVGTVTVQ